MIAGLYIVFIFTLKLDMGQWKLGTTPAFLITAF